MNGQDLKHSIHQLAIQGKLVEQREEEGTAKELIEKLLGSKKILLNENKIYKKKPTEPFYNSEDFPFDIPESWSWVQLSDISIIQEGAGIRKYQYRDFGIQLFSVTNILDGSIDLAKKQLYVSNEEFSEKYSHLQLNKGDIVTACSGGSWGKVAVYDKEDTVMLNTSTLRLRFFEDIGENKYLYYIVQSTFFKKQLQEQMVGIQPNFGYAHYSRICLPLPPVEEQKRIVAKIEELMPNVEKYGVAYSEVEELNKKFPKNMQKSILQYAIQGKLVEQREEEGTAEELYQQIQEGKAKLIKEGKIKKQKPLAEITEDEIPFDIPENWKWVRLEQVCEYIQRGKSPKYSDIQKYPVVAQKCNQWSGFSLEKAKFIDPKTIGSYTEERMLQDGDLMWNSTGLGTLGRVAKYEEDKNPYELAVADSHVTVIRLLKQFVDFKYLYYYIANPSVQSVIEKQSSGSTKQIELATNTVKNYIVPLPPVSEQKRIVAKIEELITYTKQLVK